MLNIGIYRGNILHNPGFIGLIIFIKQEFKCRITVFNFGNKRNSLIETATAFHCDLLIKNLLLCHLNFYLIICGLAFMIFKDYSIRSLVFKKFLTFLNCVKYC